VVYNNGEFLNTVTSVCVVYNNCGFLTLMMSVCVCVCVHNNCEFLDTDDFLMWSIITELLDTADVCVCGL